MKIFAVRHGQTQWNEQGRVCGRTDIPITEIGKEQAKSTGGILMDKHIDVMLCSPLLRAQMTAEIISEYIGIGYTVEERLIEQNYGIYEGLPRNDSEYMKVKAEFAYRLPQGESPLDLGRRVYNLLDDVKLQYPDKNVLFVCHGGVCRMVHTYFNSLTNKEFNNLRLDNCEVREYEM